LTSTRERWDAGAYFAGTLLQRVSLFLALPFLLRSLSAADYGAFGLLQSAVTLLPAILTLNVTAGITRLFFDGNTPLERGAIASKLTVLSAGAGVGTATAMWLSAAAARHATAAVLGVPPDDAILAAALVLVGALGSNHLQIAWSIWRAENRATVTAIANASSGALFFAAIAVLAREHRLGVMSAIAAYAGATALVGIAANILAVLGRPRRGGMRFATLAREALRYGLPILPYLLALWGLAAGGRWIARATLTLEDTGRFTLASQLAIMIGLVGRSAYDAWAPRSFEMFARGDGDAARRYLRERGLLTLAVVGILGAITALIGALALPRFAPGYAAVAVLFPLMAFAPLFDVAYLAYHTELMGMKVTQPIASYTALTVAAFVVAGVVGAKALGLWGLAGAYVAAYVLQWALARRAVRRARGHIARMRPDSVRRMPRPTPLE
jgi:O-antigen/teichoic acid export membrane protein